MEVIYIDSFSTLNHFDDLVVTIGAFDGIHLGHKKLFDKMNEYKNLKKGVITFLLHPDYILNKRNNIGVILNIDEKIKIFNKLNIDYLFIINLTNDFLNLTYLEFHDILRKINVKSVVIGKDFRYGKNTLGSIKTLKEEFDVFEVDDLLINNQKISSNEVRNLLLDGKLSLVNELLIYPFSVSGVVRNGYNEGKNLGFRTINIPMNNKINLKKGVYKTKVLYENHLYDSITNVGIHPTINKLDESIIETHIFNFDKVIYNSLVEIIFLNFIRAEKKFSSVEELKKQIRKDIENL